MKCGHVNTHLSSFIDQKKQVSCKLNLHGDALNSKSDLEDSKVIIDLNVKN